MRTSIRSVASALIVFGLSALGTAQLTVPGTTGAAAGTDGAFAPTGAEFVVDLSQATDRATVKWDADNTTNKGKGIYDREKWAVVFKYSSVNIPAGTTVKFKNNRTNAPVVWLVQGDVRIEGALNLSGGTVPVPGGTGRGEGGPGGFAGGFVDGSTGFGPGARSNTGAEYQFGSLIYGNERIIPLIGGSGGRPWDYPIYASGGGGGAVLIATPGKISIAGGVYAESRGGSGGAIRLIAGVVEGAGAVSAAANFESGWDGRVRLEANSMPLIQSGRISPAPSIDRPGAIAQIWPDTTHPIVAITKVIAGTQTVNAPADPNASFAFPLQDVALTFDGEVTVVIETLNVPTGATDRWRVRLRVGPRKGEAIWVDATLVPGSVVGAAAVWNAKVTFPAGVSAIQARAFKG